MATRAIILLEGCKIAAAYKHSDGDPESTLDWLQEFNADFVRERGEDDGYKLAQLLRSSEREKMGGDKYLGWGIIPVPKVGEYGEAYRYRLMRDGSVKCTKVVPLNDR